MVDLSWQKRLGEIFEEFFQDGRHVMHADFL